MPAKKRRGFSTDYLSPSIDIFSLLHALLTHANSGIRDYLVHRLYDMSDVDIDFCLPQLMALLLSWDVNRSYRLQEFIIAKCSQSIHLSLKVLWILQAAEYYSRKDDERHRVRDLIHGCEMSLVNASIFGEGEHTADGQPGNNKATARINQEKKRLHILNSNYYAEQQEKRRLASPTHSTSQATGGHTDARSPLPSPERPFIFGTATDAYTARIFSPVNGGTGKGNFSFNQPSTTNSAAGTEDNKNQASSSTEMSKPPQLNPHQSIPVSVEEIYFALSKKVKCEYFNLELQLIHQLILISSHLVKFPSAARKQKLRRMLSTLPSVHTDSLYLPSNTPNAPHYRILRLLGQEAVSLSSRDKAPYLLYCEIEYTSKSCFPEHDTRVLTDAGYLFMADIEARIVAGQQVRYACYDTSTCGIVYKPGQLVESTPPTHWVDFTQAGTRRLWDATSDDYGASVRMDDKQANRLTLRTTPEHEMYLQLCVQYGEGRTAQHKARKVGGAVIPPHKQTARELAPGYKCDCTAAGRTCTHGFSHYRMYTAAASGMHAPAHPISLANSDPHSPVVALGLRSADELDAFLELFGYWLGDGTMTFDTRGGPTSWDAVVFTPHKQRDRRYLRRLLARVHLVRRRDYRSWKCKHSLRVCVSDQRWFRFFSSEFGVKYKNSPHYDREQTLVKQGMKTSQRRPLAVADSFEPPSTVSAASTTRARSISTSTSTMSSSRFSSNAGQDDAACMVCGSDVSDDADNRMLLCDATRGCQRGCHVRCSGMDAVPEGDWYCATCRLQWLAGVPDDFPLDQLFNQPRPTVPLVCSGEWLARHAGAAPAAAAAAVQPAVAPAASAMEADDEDVPVVTFHEEKDEQVPMDEDDEKEQLVKDEQVKDEPDGEEEDGEEEDGEEEDDDEDEDGDDEDEDEEEEEVRLIKSAKWMPDWVLFRLDARQVRLVIEGLRRADGHSASTVVQRQSAASSGRAMQGTRRISTSGVGFRDQLIQACLHAGYSAYFTINSRADVVRGYNSVPKDEFVYRPHEMRAAKQADPTRQFTPLVCRYDNWWVCYSALASEILPAQDVRYDGSSCLLTQQRVEKVYEEHSARKQGWVAVHDDGTMQRAASQTELAELLSSTYSSISQASRKGFKVHGEWLIYSAQRYADLQSGRASKQQHVVPIATLPADRYDRERDGRVWCVKVEHDDHLVFVQRVHRNASGVVTKVGRSMIVGNCYDYDIYTAYRSNEEIMEESMELIDEATQTPWGEEGTREDITLADGSNPAPTPASAATEQTSNGEATAAAPGKPADKDSHRPPPLNTATVTPADPAKSTHSTRSTHSTHHASHEHNASLSRRASLSRPLDPNKPALEQIQQQTVEEQQEGIQRVFQDMDTAQTEKTSVANVLSTAADNAIGRSNNHPGSSLGEVAQAEREQDDDAQATQQRRLIRIRALPQPEPIVSPTKANHGPLFRVTSASQPNSLPPSQPDSPTHDMFGSSVPRAGHLSSLTELLEKEALEEKEEVYGEERARMDMAALDIARTQGEKDSPEQHTSAVSITVSPESTSSTPSPLLSPSSEGEGRSDSSDNLLVAAAKKMSHAVSSPDLQAEMQKNNDTVNEADGDAKKEKKSSNVHEKKSVKHAAKESSAKQRSTSSGITSLTSTTPSAHATPHSTGRPTLQAPAEPAYMRNPAWQKLDAAFGDRWDARKRRVFAASPNQHLERWDLLSCIFKSGDDCRQEVLAMQLIMLFDHIWREAKLPLWLRPYSVLITSPTSGLIETIQDATSVDALKKSMLAVDPYASLSSFFHLYFGLQGTDRHVEAVRNFAESMAGYSVICYLLQIKDRHNGNIMLDREGHVIHIDYGFMLSNSPGRNWGWEQSPFKLTSEYITVMTIDTHHSFFPYFRTLVVQGYMEARKHWHVIHLLIQLMMRAQSLPCFAGAGEAGTLQQLRQRFMVDATDEEALQHAMSLIDQSIDNWRTHQYDRFQRMTNGIV